jgi:RNA polymerase sigma-70 factor (ECF subfamily)
MVEQVMAADATAERPRDRPGGPSDDEVRAACAGDRAAFDRIFRRYAPLVHGVLLARARPLDVDDLMQDVFVTALEKIATLRDGDALGAWLCAIARNRAADAQRRRRHLDDLPEDLGRPDAERAEAERVLRAIQELPEAYREPLILRLVEGMTGPEIAAQVGIKPESVRVNLHRGMKLLRQKLGLATSDDHA